MAFARLVVATFNLRNTTDRYSERENLLLDTLRELGARIIGCQEVSFTKQSPKIQAALKLRKDKNPSASVEILEAPSKVKYPPPYPDFDLDGNAIVIIESNGANEEGEAVIPCEYTLRAVSHEVSYLSEVRVAQRALIAIYDTRIPASKPVEVGRFWFVNTHLHHTIPDEQVRLEQSTKVIQWMASDTKLPIIISGDFNAPPSEPTYAAFIKAGYQSAFAVANGHEPKTTFPSGLQAPTMDTDEDRGPLDYLWVKNVRVHAAWVAANKPSPTDPTLYPSDHYAVVADISVPLCFEA